MRLACVVCVTATLYLLGAWMQARQLAGLENAYAQPRVTPLIQQARERTWRCQDQLGVTRTRVSRLVPVGRAYRRYVLSLWRTRQQAYCGVLRALREPANAVRAVFGPAADEALRVFECESHLQTWARNGQYLGLAQMGNYARSRYGHSDTALGQARAAYAYYRAAGWGPWECARLVGVA